MEREKEGGIVEGGRKGERKLSVHQTSPSSSHLQEHDLAVGSLRICWIGECIKYLLEGHNLPRPAINTLPHYTIGLERGREGGREDRTALLS